MGAITACRTAALGGRVEAYDDSGATRVGYNSRRNRHCPKCQRAAREQWLAERQAELLPVPYFHAVFTFPPPIAAMAFQNKVGVYAILQELRRGNDDAGCQSAQAWSKIGGLAILHTWGQALTPHPHVHCVAPGGGVSLAGSQWIEGARTSFSPSSRFSGCSADFFSNACKWLLRQRVSAFLADLARLADPAAFAALLAAMRRVDWIVYLKKPFGGPAQALAYLGRYTHRVAIASSCIQACDDKHVWFTSKAIATTAP